MSKQEWFRSWFDSPYYPILYRNRDFSEARQFIDALLSFLKPEKQASFLDVACGRGRHSIYLNSLGFEVTGIDISENSIEEAKASASSSLHFHVHDMRLPLELPQFHVALNLFTSFGYFDTWEEHIESLQNIHNTLNPNGLFVLDYLNTSYIQKQLVHFQHDEANGVKFTISKSIQGQHIVKKIEVEDGAKSYEFEERVMAFSKEDLTGMLEQVGFRIEQTFGDYQLNAMTEEATRVIIIARKS